MTSETSLLHVHKEMTSMIIIKNKAKHFSVISSSIFHMDLIKGGVFQKDHPLSFVLWENYRALFSFSLISLTVPLGTEESLVSLRQAETSNCLLIYYISELICEQQLISIKPNKEKHHHQVVDNYKAHYYMMQTLA